MQKITCMDHLASYRSLIPFCLFLVVLSSFLVYSMDQQLKICLALSYQFKQMILPEGERMALQNLEPNYYGIHARNEGLN